MHTYYSQNYAGIIYLPLLFTEILEELYTAEVQLFENKQEDKIISERWDFWPKSKTLLMKIYQVKRHNSTQKIAKRSGTK